MTRQITFLIYRDSLGARFEPIAWVPAVCMRRIGYHANILCMAPLGEYMRPGLRARWRKRKEQSEIRLPGGVARIPVSPSRLSRWLDDTVALARWMKKNADAHIIICCGAAAANFALQARRRAGANIHVVFHSLGPVAEEYAYALTGNERAKLNPLQTRRWEELRHWENTAYKESDAVICISEAMQNHAVALRGRRSSILLTPCVTDTEAFSKEISQRDAVRMEMGWQNRLVVVFCGALHAWQRMDALIQVFKIIKSVAPEAFFLLLPHRSAGLDKLLIQSGISPQDYAIIQADRNRLPKWLAASDMGLLGRGLFEDSSLINTFSSPIKVGEYLAAGLPVIMSEGVGDASALVSSRNVGCVLAHHADDAQIQTAIRAFLEHFSKDRESIRERCVETARAHLDIHLFTEALDQLVRKL